LDILKHAISDGYKRLIEPSIEREIRNTLTQKAEAQAIDVFSVNLKNLLLQPPLKGRTVLGLDPAFRTGCKLAVIDETGKVQDIRNTLTEKAEAQSIDVFSVNLQNLLLQPPLKGRTVLGVDPAFRTGCKLAVIDETGKVQDIRVIYPTAPKHDVAGSEKEVLAL